jgi:hypothetical protein
MTQGLRSSAVIRRQRHGRALGLVVSLVCAGGRMAHTIRAAEAAPMPPEPPAAGAQEPITPVPLSLALDPRAGAHAGGRRGHDGEARRGAVPGEV